MKTPTEHIVVILLNVKKFLFFFFHFCSLFIFLFQRLVLESDHNTTNVVNPVANSVFTTLVVLKTFSGPAPGHYHGT